MLRSFHPLLMALPLLVVFTTALGCTSEDDGHNSSIPAMLPGGMSNPDQQHEFPLTIRDALSREITLPSRPQRIISLAPKNTELLFAIDADEFLVGTTAYCNYPPEARDVPNVGGFASNSISMETLISFQPNLVLAVGNLQRATIDELERLNVPVIALSAESLSDLYAEIELLGKITRRESNAEELVHDMQRRVAHIEQLVEDIPESERVRVFYQVWDEPLSAATPVSFIGELIELAGGRNVFQETSTPYLKISEEVLLERDPEVIIVPSVLSQPASVEQFLQKSSWSDITAICQGRVYVLDGDLVSRCGPRLVDALEIIASLLYPERFGTESQSPGVSASNERSTP